MAFGMVEHVAICIDCLDVQPKGIGRRIASLGDHYVLNQGVTFWAPIRPEYVGKTFLEVERMMWPKHQRPTFVRELKPGEDSPSASEQKRHQVIHDVRRMAPAHWE